ncbi:MAG: hypothetical protein WBW31_08550, partial [Candidatus Sulfotelmatobacter sp.]
GAERQAAPRGINFGRNLQEKGFVPGAMRRIEALCISAAALSPVFIPTDCLQSLFLRLET